MSYRDNFSSDMSSPGNYSKSGTYGGAGYSGNYGGSNNPGGGGYTTIAQKNFARAGGSFGPGAGFGSLLGGYNDGIRSGPIPPALGPQGIPQAYIQEPVAPPPGRQLTAEELARLAAQRRYQNAFRWPTVRRDDMANVNAAYQRMGNWINQEYDPLSSVNAPTQSGKAITDRHPYVGRDMFAGQYRDPTQNGGYSGGAGFGSPSLGGAGGYTGGRGW